MDRSDEISQNAIAGLPLDLSPGQVSEILTKTQRFLVETVDAIAGQQSFVPPLIRTKTSEPAGFPETGQDFSSLLQEIALAAEEGDCISSAGYMAYVPNGGIVMPAVADLISGVLNRFTGLKAASPSLLALEEEALRWLTGIVGWDGRSAAILTSGASLATVSALACARDRAPADVLDRGTIYVSDESHFAVLKAARLIGIRQDQIRVIETNGFGRFDVDAAKKAITADVSGGLLPFCLVATAGSASNGAIDPLNALADLALEYNLWLHVDAAYGGFFCLTKRGLARLTGIERADSIVMDLHKGLFFPFGTGSLLVRDVTALRRVHQKPAAASYIQDLCDVAVPERLDLSDLTPELTRPFRGLRLWLALKLHGVASFRNKLDQKLDLARHAFARLTRIQNLEVDEPDLTIVTFRMRNRLRDYDSDRGTQFLMNAVNRSGDVHISSSRIHGRLTGRIAILGHRTSQAHVDTVVDRIDAAMQLMLAMDDGDDPDDLDIKLNKSDIALSD
ncbi:aspartate aminotransferase family protein [Rhizobium johnstonii]|uniref:pyridoxal phosphate-dependent decarboxylase family protein n=1 Tax=Rhizobium johnstonii TaxID=3019933 RepID=UPI003F98523B